MLLALSSKDLKTSRVYFQRERYNASAHLHAKHDKDLLATRHSKDISPFRQNSLSELKSEIRSFVHGPSHKHSLLSDVCCQDVDNMAVSSQTVLKSMNVLQQVPRPPKGDIELRIAILTVSDRAATNSYTTGDLSGPAVERTVMSQIDLMNSSFSEQKVILAHLEKKIVADEISDIRKVLMHWAGKLSPSHEVHGDSKMPYDIIFTTGGTGFAPRDVTPEATLSILDRECQGLISWASMELSTKQPLATLSRAAAGLCNETLIINLPGNPAGAAQVVELLFPLLLHAVTDLHKSS